MRRLLATQAPAATILIRIVVGGIFLTEGIQKFLYPGDLGAGRFAKIGIPAPDVMGPFIGGIEIVCGALLIIGLLTRLFRPRLPFCLATVSGVFLLQNSRATDS